MTDTDLTQMLTRLDRIEAAIQSLVERKTVKQWYSVDDAAAVLGKARYTVRQWCRLGRIQARKHDHARGPHPEWVIAHGELARVQAEGLRPLPPRPGGTA